MDKVELFLNGKSLGAQEMQKDHHLAWNVAYEPGTIEARGYKDGKLVLTEKRETTGAAAAIVLSVDRPELKADGEDVAMVAVEVRDARGRLMPIADNKIAFKVSGAGKLIGTGNGDPTDQDADKGSERKAFCGLCMAIVQSGKTAGTITVEATAAGLKPATVTINTKAMKLRPQVTVWDRAIPTGGAASGLWRPEHEVNQLFILSQDGSKLTGSGEGVNGSWAGGNDVPVTLEDGVANGNSVSFKLGGTEYSGTVDGDRMELSIVPHPNRHERPDPLELADKSLAIGPAPDGSDPSGYLWHGQPPKPMVLHRVKR
jgi:beta-galactosidase